MKGKDWKKTMEEAGFKHMDFVKSAKEEVTRDKAAGWAYMVVAVDLEIKLPNGYFSRDKVKVDMELLKAQNNPDSFLCETVLTHIKKSMKAAGIEYKAGPENNKPD